MPPSSPRSPWLRPILAVVALVLLAVGGYFALNQRNMIPGDSARQPAPFPTPAETRDGRWQQDVTYLATQLTTLHPDPFTQISAEAFVAQTDALLAQIPTQDDTQILLGMVALTAALGDGHTEMEFYDAERLHLLPLALGWYGDALVVVGAQAAYSATIGSRVTQIGITDPQAALAAVTPFIAHDNEQQLLQRSPRFLTTPELLVAVGILPDVDLGKFELESPEGELFSLEVAPVRIDENIEFLTLYDVSDITPPLRTQNSSSYYWYTYLPDTQTVYFHYFRCADEPENPFVEFNRELFAFIDDNPVTRIIVDLRFNGGGDSSVLQPFIDDVQKRETLNQSGGLYVLIGRQTFSSALMNAVELKTETAAILLGEPTGGKPNHFGEVQMFSLPNSELRVQYSTRYFTTMPGNDAPSLVPDLAFPITWEDLQQGRDPAVDAALAGVKPS